MFTCLWWQVTLCDPIWQATSRKCEMGVPLTAIIYTPLPFFTWDRYRWSDKCYHAIRTILIVVCCTEVTVIRRERTCHCGNQCVHWFPSVFSFCCFCSGLRTPHITSSTDSRDFSTSLLELFSPTLPWVMTTKKTHTSIIIIIERMWLVWHNVIKTARNLNLNLNVDGPWS